MYMCIVLLKQDLSDTQLKYLGIVPFRGGLKAEYLTWIASTENRISNNVLCCIFQSNEYL